MLKVRKHDAITEIQLDRPPVNAMTPEFLRSFAEAQAAALTDGARALVISGREGLFSAGLDVPALIKLDRDGMEAFWELFFGTMRAVASSPVPVLAAITGHAPAGGMVLALHCDYRVATRGDFRMGLNEVAVGIPVPRNIFGALEMAVGHRAASLMTLQGQMLLPEDALEVGLVDTLAEPGAAVQVAVSRAQAWLELPPRAMNRTRLAAKSDFLERTSELRAYVRVATDAWFGDETQRMLRALVERLGK